MRNELHNMIKDQVSAKLIDSKINQTDIKVAEAISILNGTI